MSSKLTITFNEDGTVDTSLDKDINANVLLLGLTKTLAGFIEETSETAQFRNRAINIVCEKLQRGKDADEIVREHKAIIREYGDGYHEPREEAVYCQCGSFIGAWQQFYEENPDWEQDWLDHLAFVEHGIVPSPIYSELHSDYEVMYASLNQALIKLMRIDCSIPGARSGGLF